MSPDRPVAKDPQVQLAPLDTLVPLAQLDTLAQRAPLAPPQTLAPLVQPDQALEPPAQQAIQAALDIPVTQDQQDQAAQ